MSDLETAAHAALERVRVLEAALEGGESRCVNATTHLDSVRAFLGTDRAALRAAVEALEGTASAAASRLEAQMAAVGQELDEVAEAAREVLAQGPPALGAEGKALQHTGERLGELENRVIGLGEAAERTARAAVQKAAELEEALKASIDEVERLLAVDVVSLLAAARQQADQAELMATTIRASVIHQVFDARKEWAQRLATAHDVADRAFAEMERHAAEVASYAAAEAAELVEAEERELENQAQAVVTRLEGVLQSLSQRQGMTQVASDMLITQLTEATGHARAIEDEIYEMRERWTRGGVL